MEKFAGLFYNSLVKYICQSLSVDSGKVMAAQQDNYGISTTYLKRPLKIYINTKQFLLFSWTLKSS